MSHSKAKRNEPTEPRSDNSPPEDSTSRSGGPADTAGSAKSATDANASSEMDAGSPAAILLDDELEQLRRELDEARTRGLRAVAEMENVRKRMRREMDEERRYASLLVLSDLLPVMDNVQRAIQAAEKAHDSGGLLEGFKMVAQQLDGVLTRHQCVRIDAQGQPFDPHQHSAVMQQPAADLAPGTVVSVVQDGYRLHDRVIRPAQVIVASAPPSS